MKQKNNTLLKSMQTIMVIVALIFTCDMNATSSSWFSFSKTHSSSSSSKTVTKHSKVKVKQSKSSYYYIFIKKKFTIWNQGTNQGGGSTPAIPLDGGLSFLLLGAAAFGVKKLGANRNDKA